MSNAAFSYSPADPVSAIQRKQWSTNAPSTVPHHSAIIELWNSGIAQTAWQRCLRATTLFKAAIRLRIWFLMDAVLNELKEQSPEGCLLCSFDAWDEEEWD